MNFSSHLFSWLPVPVAPEECTLMEQGRKTSLLSLFILDGVESYLGLGFYAATWAYFPLISACIIWTHIELCCKTNLKTTADFLIFAISCAKVVLLKKKQQLCVQATSYFCIHEQKSHKLIAGGIRGVRRDLVPPLVSLSLPLLHKAS